MKTGQYKTSTIKSKEYTSVYHSPFCLFVSSIAAVETVEEDSKSIVRGSILW